MRQCSTCSVVVLLLWRYVQLEILSLSIFGTSFYNYSFFDWILCIVWFVFFLVSSDGYVRGLSAGRAAQPIEEVSGHLSGLVEV